MGETLVGTHKLVEAVEQPCSGLPAHTPEVCKVIPGPRIAGDTGRPRLMGNVYHPCKEKTVMTAVLTVKSSLDPHLISGNGWDGWIGHGWLVWIG